MTKPDHENILQHVVFRGELDKGPAQLFRRAANYIKDKDLWGLDNLNLTVTKDDREWILTMACDYENEITLKKVRELLDKNTIKK